MSKSVKNLFYLGLSVGIIIFVICCFISKPSGLLDIFSRTGEAITITLIFLGLYERFLWRYFTKINDTPRIYGTYEGFVEFDYNGPTERSEFFANIKQTLLTVHISITTKRMTSYTITNQLRKTDEGKYIIFYTYYTNPKDKYAKTSPMHYGACRLSIINDKLLQGEYWNALRRSGDITFIKKEH